MSITVVKNEQGQSLIEFLLMMPILFGLVFVLVRVNTVIQMSIVDQQYARAQTLFLAFNNGVYPEITRQRELGTVGHNRMSLGVSDNAPGGGGDAEYLPIAANYSVTRKGNKIPQDSTPGYPYDPNDPTAPGSPRGDVRVRNTATLCTPSNFLKTSAASGALVDTGYPAELSNSSAFAYCESSMKFEGEL